MEIRVLLFKALPVTQLPGSFAPQRGSPKGRGTTSLTPLHEPLVPLEPNDGVTLHGPWQPSHLGILGAIVYASSAVTNSSLPDQMQAQL